MIYKEINLPDNLEEATKRYIFAVIDQLAEVKKINSLDEGSLYMLASSYNAYLKCKEIVDIEGYTYSTERGCIYARPEVKIMIDNQKQCVNLMREIGLTVRSRKSLDVITAETEDSPLIKFVKESANLL